MNSEITLSQETIDRIAEAIISRINILPRETKKLPYNQDEAIEATFRVVRGDKEALAQYFETHEGPPIPTTAKPPKAEGLHPHSVKKAESKNGPSASSPKNRKVA